MLPDVSEVRLTFFLLSCLRSTELSLTHSSPYRPCAGTNGRTHSPRLWAVQHIGPNRQPYSTGSYSTHSSEAEQPSDLHTSTFQLLHRDSEAPAAHQPRHDKLVLKAKAEPAQPTRLHKTQSTEQSSTGTGHTRLLPTALFKCLLSEKNRHQANEHAPQQSPAKHQGLIREMDV